METKVCNKCKKEKSISDFGLDNRNSDGYKSVCKICLKEYKQMYDLKNKDKKKEYNEKYKKDNSDKVKMYEQERYQKNRETILVYNRKYKETNKERDRERNNKSSREYKKNRCSVDQLYKLKINIRGLISVSIKRSGYKKNTKSVNILGCEMDEFKTYLESKFESWMNWDNHGKYNGELNYGWDIDHIIPISSASTEEEVIKLNHYTNLQPLCSYINRYVKKNKK